MRSNDGLSHLLVIRWFDRSGLWYNVVRFHSSIGHYSLNTSSIHQVSSTLFGTHTPVPDAIFLLLLLLVSLGRTRKFLFLLGKTFPVNFYIHVARPCILVICEKDGRKKKGGEDITLLKKDMRSGQVIKFQQFVKSAFKWIARSLIPYVIFRSFSLSFCWNVWNLFFSFSFYIILLVVFQSFSISQKVRHGLSLTDIHSQSEWKKFK